jgi:branched-chain amino acid transport system substrate-binding protein
MLTRRRALQLGSAGLGTLALAQTPLRARAQSARPIVIGYVSPQTGPLAAFGEADAFVIAAMQKQFSKGITVGGKTHPVEIVVKDSQSTSNRAGEVASDLILKNKVDVMLVASTPETTNPVSDQCELNGVPCISTVAPWQPWFFARKGDPQKGFDWTYHFFWGLEDVIAAYTTMWQAVPTDKSVGGLFANDGDGNAWGDTKLGFPPVLSAKGYKLTDPGRFQPLTTDFSAQISAFKSASVQVVTGVPIPPDFKTFWTQAKQQGFKPKVASIGKALLFPSTIEAIGPTAINLSTEVWWTPHHPFRSSLTHQSSAELAAAYEASTHKQWTQPLGFAHALFEIAADALGRASDLEKKESIRDAIAATNLKTVVGTVAWGHGPVKNVAKTPLVGGQWVKGKKYPFELVIVENATAPIIPKQATLLPLPG